MHIVALRLALVTALVLAGCGLAVADAVKDFRGAQAAYRQGDHQRALELFTAAITSGEFKGRNLGTVHNNRGVVLDILKDHRGAVADFTKGIELNPQSALGHRGRGEANAALGNHEAALADLGAALNRKPKNSGILNSRAASLAALGRHEQAAQDLEKALRHDPSYAKARENLRKAYTALGRTEKLAALDAAGLVAEGYNHFKKNQIDKAVALYTKALARDPDNLDATLKRATAHFHKRRYDAARTDYTAVLRLDPKHWAAAYNRGLIHQNLGRHGDAVKDFDVALTLRPLHAKGLMRRATSFMTMKDFAGAADDYSAVLAKLAGKTQARIGRARALYSLGRFAPAQADFKIAVLDPGRRPDKRIYTALWKYLAARHAGQDKAVDELRQDMGKIGAHTNKVLGRTIDLFGQAWPGPVAALYLGDTDEAALRVAADKLKGQSKEGRAAEVDYYLGEHLLLQGKTDAARKAFQATIASDLTSYLEYDFALGHLKRIGG